MKTFEKFHKSSTVHEIDEAQGFSSFVGKTMGFARKVKNIATTGSLNKPADSIKNIASKAAAKTVKPNVPATQMSKSGNQMRGVGASLRGNPEAKKKAIQARSVAANPTPQTPSSQSKPPAAAPQSKRLSVSDKPPTSQPGSQQSAIVKAKPATPTAQPSAPQKGGAIEKRKAQPVGDFVRSVKKGVDAVKKKAPEIKKKVDDFRKKNVAANTAAADNVAGKVKDKISNVKDKIGKEVKDVKDTAKDIKDTKTPSKKREKFKKAAEKYGDKAESGVNKAAKAVEKVYKKGKFEAGRGKNKNFDKVASKVVKDKSKRKAIGDAVGKVAARVGEIGSRKGVRELGSKLNTVRKNLPTADDYRTGNEGTGFGFGGRFKGKSLKMIGNALDKEGKKFEKSEIQDRTALGRTGGKRRIVSRGRELDADGNPIDKKKDTSLKGRAADFIKRKFKVKDKGPDPEKKASDNVTGVETTGIGPTDDKGQSAKIDRDAKTASGKGKVGGRTDKELSAQTNPQKLPDGVVRVNVDGTTQLARKTDLKSRLGGDQTTKTPYGKYGTSGKRRITGDVTSSDYIQKIDPNKKTVTDPDTGKKKTVSVPTAVDKDGATRTADRRAKRGDKSMVNQRQKRQEKKPLRTGGRDIDPKALESGKNPPEKKKEDKVTTNKTPRKRGRPPKKQEPDKVTVNKTKRKETPKTETKSLPPAKETPKKETPKKETKKLPQGKETKALPPAKETPKAKRRNIKNKKYYDTDEKTGKKTFNQQRYDADKNSVKTKSGGGRPKSKTLEKGKPARDAKRKQAKDGAINTFSNKPLKGVNTKTMVRDKKGSPLANAPETKKKSETNTQIKDKTDSQLNKMKNRGERRAKRNDAKFTSGSFDVANTQGKFRKKEERKISKRMSKPKVTKESFSHWREEFIWETDKKYPDKVKEIKPMSGKNTITINPEDETAKYKRGY